MDKFHTVKTVKTEVCDFGLCRTNADNRELNVVKSKQTLALDHTVRHVYQNRLTKEGLCQNCQKTKVSQCDFYFFKDFFCDHQTNQPTLFGMKCTQNTIAGTTSFVSAN